MELIVTISIVSVVSGVVLLSFNGYRQREMLKAATLEVVSVAREARAKTVVAQDDNVYGIHFDIDQVVLFAGSVYDADDDSNQVSALSVTIGLATTTLGADEIIFSRLSGEPSVSGSVIVYQLNNPTSSTTVTINEAGIISSP